MSPWHANANGAGTKGSAVDSSQEGICLAVAGSHHLTNFDAALAHYAARAGAALPSTYVPGKCGRQISPILFHLSGHIGAHPRTLILRT
jgi:hypothetical protein